MILIIILARIHIIKTIYPSLSVEKNMQEKSEKNTQIVIQSVIIIHCNKNTNKGKSIIITIVMVNIHLKIIERFKKFNKILIKIVVELPRKKY